MTVIVYEKLYVFLARGLLFCRDCVAIAHKTCGVVRVVAGKLAEGSENDSDRETYRGA